MSGKKSQDKGKRGEREVCAWKACDSVVLAERSLTQCDRGRGDDVNVDIRLCYADAPPDWRVHLLGVESKRSAQPLPRGFMKHYEQAVQTAKRNGRLPVLRYRQDRKEAIISMPESVWLKILGKLP